MVDRRFGDDGKLMPNLLDEHAQLAAGHRNLRGDPGLDRVESRVDSGEPRIHPAKSRVDGAEPRVDLIEARVDGVESPVHRVESRVQLAPKLIEVRSGFVVHASTLSGESRTAQVSGFRYS